MTGLDDIFESFKTQGSPVALAFSGGVDSSFLLYAALKSGVKVNAYYVKSEFQPGFEFEDGLRLGKELGVEIKVIKASVLENEKIKANPSNRCYFCKKAIFGKIIEAALKDGCRIILEGTNASDDISDRPGYKALQELEVRSPLREAGLRKEKIRELSREAGLFTWNKPSYACLATRIPSGISITKEDLEITEKGEALMMEMGYSDFRIRKNGKSGRIQVTESQLEKVIKERKILIEKLSPLYENISVDLETRKSND